MNDPFSVLGLDPRANPTDTDIKNAWRRAAREHPPETDPAGFERVRAAYEMVRDPASYARTLLDGPVPEFPPAKNPHGAPTPLQASESLLRYLLATGELRFD